MALAACDLDGSGDTDDPDPPDDSGSMTTVTTSGGSSSGDGDAGGSTGDGGSSDDASVDGGSTAGALDGGSTGGSTGGGGSDGGSTGAGAETGSDGGSGGGSDGSSDGGSDGGGGTGGPGEEALYTFGNVGWDYLTAVGVDSSGDVYLGGRSQGDFVGDLPPGSTPGFVHKVAEDGTPDWFVQFVNPGSFATVDGLAVDGDDNVIVIGSTTGPFIAKLDADGNELWTLAPGIGVTCVAVDSEDNIIVAGQGPTGDAVVHKYPPNGGDPMTAPAPMFTALVGEGNMANERALAVAVDGDDNVHIAGTTTGVFTTANLGGTDAIVAMLNPSLVEFAARRAQWGTAFDDAPTAIAVDDAGAAYVSGTTATVFVFMGIPFPELDGFVRKYDDTGEVWASTYESVVDPGVEEIIEDTPAGLVIDGTGEVFVAGQMAQLGDETLGGGGDIVERVHDPDDGSVASTLFWGTVNLDGANAVTLGPWGPIVAGYTFGVLKDPESQDSGDRQLWVRIP